MASGEDEFMMDLRVRLQVVEAFGPTNRWFCSEAYGRPIDDPEVLLRYYIKSGGACDFARRFNLAMGTQNRWYCSEFYGRDIGDPEILWDYFVDHSQGRTLRRSFSEQSDCSRLELCVAD